MQHRPAIPKLLPKTKPIAPTNSHVSVDKGYTGQTVTTAAINPGVTVYVVSGPKPGHGLIIQPRRRVLEPTNAWINHRRRLNRHHEITPAAHKGFPYLSQIALLLRQLDRTQ